MPTARNYSKTPTCNLVFDCTDPVNKYLTDTKMVQLYDTARSAIYRGDNIFSINENIHLGNIIEVEQGQQIESSGYVLSRDFYFQNAGYDKFQVKFKYMLHEWTDFGGTDFGSYLGLFYVSHTGSVQQIYEASTNPSGYGKGGVAVPATHKEQVVFEDNVGGERSVPDPPGTGKAEWHAIRLKLGFRNGAKNMLTYNPGAAGDIGSFNYQGFLEDSMKFNRFYGLHRLSLHLSGTCE